MKKLHKINIEYLLLTIIFLFAFFIRIYALGIPSFWVDESNSAIEGDMGNTEIRVSYTDAEVSAAGITESSLRLYYYNDTDSSWNVYDTPNGGVDTTANYVWAITDHFSIWGIFGSAPTSSSDSSRGHGGTVTSYASPKNLLLNTNLSEEGGVPEPISTGKPEEGTKGFFATITGAMVGALGSATGVVVIIFILGLGGSIHYSKNNQKEKY